MQETVLEKFINNQNKISLEYSYFVQQGIVKEIVSEKLYEEFINLDSLVRLDIINSDTERINIKYYKSEEDFLIRYFTLKIKEASTIYTPESVPLELIENEEYCRTLISDAVKSSTYKPLPELVERAELNFRLKTNRSEVFEGDIDYENIANVLLMDQYSIESIEVQLSTTIGNRIGTVNKLIGKSCVGFICDYKDIKFLKDNFIKQLKIQGCDSLQYKVTLVKEIVYNMISIPPSFAYHIVDSFELNEYVKLIRR